MEVFFDVRLPPGMTEIVIQVVQDETQRELKSVPVFSESAYRGGQKMGHLPTSLEFDRPGYYTFRLKVGELVMERELCVWTPQTKHLYAKDPE